MKNTFCKSYDFFFYVIIFYDCYVMQVLCKFHGFQEQILCYTVTNIFTRFSSENVTY
jgi:hypothetical protein